ncbi:MAG TPA: carboxy-S-adenosyl-L-methionine synthase CmoA [Woeseiaceae bacterium]|nr:carboxy-S-adenosyl-L-methionine synthase CmoA [Woeseiaceae bacterium]
MSEDRVFVDEKLGDEPFRFDESVARVFPDMLRRSIPGYEASLEASRYVRANTRCYDLGCSLGAATLAMRQGIRASGCTIIAIDNAAAMTGRCEQLIASDTLKNGNDVAVEIVQGDLQDLPISNASMVVMNYTLQFLARDSRAGVVQNIHDGLVDGGILVLSEKVIDEDPDMEALLVDLYHEHKRRNRYSALEIARKRAALENVLVPETVAEHRSRLRAAGFARSAVWLQYFNFVSIIAIKSGQPASFADE